MLWPSQLPSSNETSAGNSCQQSSARRDLTGQILQPSQWLTFDHHISITLYMFPTYFHPISWLFSFDAS